MAAEATQVVPFPDRIADLEHRLAVANQMIIILQGRLNTADNEAVQARISRDSYRDKILTLMRAMREQGIELIETK